MSSKIFELIDLIEPTCKGEEKPILHESMSGKYRMLFRNYSFCWFPKHNNFRCWEKDPDNKTVYGGYDKK